MSKQSSQDGANEVGQFFLTSILLVVGHIVWSILMLFILKGNSFFFSISLCAVSIFLSLFLVYIFSWFAFIPLLIRNLVKNKEIDEGEEKMTKYLFISAIPASIFVHWLGGALFGRAEVLYLYPIIGGIYGIIGVYLVFKGIVKLEYFDEV